MHARSDTIDRLPTFADAFVIGRGILIVHTFNEGEELPNGNTKQWVITPKNGRPIAIVVICEKWTNGGEKLDTFIQVATPANHSSTGRLGDMAGRNGRSFEDGGKWTMTEQEPTRKAKPAKPTKDDGQVVLI